jgi:nitrogen regulatory protein P-II 1
VKVALGGIGVYGMTVTEVKGHGRQGGHVETYRGAEYQVDLVPKVRVEVLCSDERQDAVVAAILEGARTGKFGDGKVWVLDLGTTARIRTDERGPEAV